jgi:non-specific serine/threonine protein kinase
VLFVVDNCEHVLAAVSDLIVDVLGVSERLTVLATSREALTVPGEQVMAVTALDEGSAVELFLARASEVAPVAGVEDPGAARAIGSICGRLDGMPLAIELAAAQVVAFTPQQIEARLTDRFALLRTPVRGRGPRHAALEAALGWSYDLLGVAERVLLDRLAVFRGRFGVAAVETVTTDVVVGSGTVVGVLTRLVRKSLVVAETAGDERRYRLLETVREYGWARLAAAHELERWRQRHLDWVLDLMAHTVDTVSSVEQTKRFATLDEELPNIEAALEWSLHAPVDAARALTAVEGLRSYWMAGGIRRAHGLRWLQATVAAAESLDAATRARALLDAVIFYSLDDLRSARTLADAVLAVAGDDPAAQPYAALAAAFVQVHGGADAEHAAREAMAGIAPEDELHWWARYMLALDLGRRGRLVEAAAALREVIEALREFGDEHHADGTLTYVADLALGAGDVDAARTDAQRALTTGQRFECASCVAQALIELALIERREDPEQRLAMGRRALRLAHRVGETWNILAALDLIAAAYADSGRYELAVTVGAAASTLRARSGFAPVLPTRGAELDRALATARTGVDAATFAERERDGGALDMESAVALALG